MSILLNRRIFPVVVVLSSAALAWNAGAIRAQNQASSSPEAVSNQFANYLAYPPQSRYHQYPDKGDVFSESALKTGIFSRNSLTQFRPDALGLQLMKLSNQLKEPHFKAYISQSDTKSARVQVESDEALHSHEVVLVYENEAWKVDIGATDALWNKAGAPIQSKAALSPEEVAKQFIDFLVGLANMPHNTDLYLVFEKAGPISQKSLADLGDSISLLLFNMANQFAKPHFKTRLLSSNVTIAHVQVERDEKAPPHEVVLLRENGAWKVDVVATYASWNKVDETQALKRIRATFGLGTRPDRGFGP